MSALDAPKWGRCRVEKQDYCSHCRQRHHRFVGGRCPACYTYWRTHGHERPPELIRRCYTHRRWLEEPGPRDA